MANKQKTKINKPMTNMCKSGCGALFSNYFKSQFLSKINLKILSHISLDLVKTVHLSNYNIAPSQKFTFSPEMSQT